MKLAIPSAGVTAIVACVAVLAACGGAQGGDVARTPQQTGGERLVHRNVSIAVPDRWYGRIGYLDPEGVDAILQVANFKLLRIQPFEPPPELPLGQEDPIKAMTGDDVLITVNTRESAGTQRSLPIQITSSSFLPQDSIEIPRNHAVARETGCFNGRCLHITVDFASSPPSQDALRAANDVLASLGVSRS